MHAVLIVIHLIVAVALTFVVLLQRSEGGALGMGGGGSGLGGLFSARGATNTLTRTTVILGTLFFVTSMSLTLLTLGTRQPTSIINPGQPVGVPGAPGAPPSLPGLPSLPTPTGTPAPGGALTPPPAIAPAPALAPAPAAPAPATPPAAPATKAPAAPAPAAPATKAPATDRKSVV